jgi:hypothetical protein
MVQRLLTIYILTPKALRKIAALNLDISITGFG